MQKRIPKVLFNASVILAGLKSPAGGSAKLLNFTKSGKITGVISEIILDEVIRNCPKLALNTEKELKKINEIFTAISPAPRESFVNAWKNIVIDYGDAHILASAKELKVDYLVTLDQKHLLSIQRVVKSVKIVSPKDLIEKLSSSN